MLRVDHHVEVPAAAILGGELGTPVAGEEIRVLHAGTAAGEHAEPLVVEMVVVRQRQQGAAGGELADPVMRNVIGEPIAEVAIATVDQQVDRMRADRAAGERITLARQAEPAQRAGAGGFGHPFRGGGEAGGRDGEAGGRGGDS